MLIAARALTDSTIMCLGLIIPERDILLSAMEGNGMRGVNEKLVVAVLAPFFFFFFVAEADFLVEYRV